MNRLSVTLVPGGSRKSLGRTVVFEPGELLGRKIRALGLDDPQISEAHAQVVLREGRLTLLALRGQLWIDGLEVGAIPLYAGLEIALAPGIVVHVQAVEHPSHVPTLQVGEAGPPQLLWPLGNHVTSDGRLRRGTRAGEVEVWNEDGGWFLRVPGQAEQPLPEGIWVEVGECEVRFAHLVLDEVGEPPTLRQELPPIEIRCLARETRITIGPRPPVRLVRTSHLVLRELGRLTVPGGPVPWRALAEAVWPPRDEGDRDHERLWQQKRKRLRIELAETKLPPWLVRSRNGLVQLQLRPQDQFAIDEPTATNRA